MIERERERNLSYIIVLHDLTSLLNARSSQLSHRSIDLVAVHVEHRERGSGIINYKRVKQTPTWLRRSMCRCDPHQYVISLLIIYVFIYRTCKCYVYGECVDIANRAANKLV